MTRHAAIDLRLRLVGPTEIRPLGWGSSAGIVAAALLLAFLSYEIWPTESIHDPNAWLIWADQLLIGHLTALVGTSTSWKPLPVLVSAAPMALSPALGSATWMILTRACSLLGAILLFRIAARAGGLFAGTLAALAPLLIKFWSVGTLSGGIDAPTATFLLAAVEAWLAGTELGVLTLLATACLLKLEILPLLGMWSIWLIRGRGWRALVPIAASSLVMAVAWIAAPWLLLGDALQVLHRTSDWVMAGHPGSWPWTMTATALGTGSTLALVSIGALFAVGTADAVRNHRPSTLGALAVGGGTLGCDFAVRLAGSPVMARYLLAGLVPLCALFGAGSSAQEPRRPSVRLVHRGSGRLPPQRWLSL